VKYIPNDSTDPYFNLAAEEYVLHNLKDDDFFMLWRNAGTVVIGRHQNAMEEVDLRRAEELGVSVVRRNTGGGAVYHDPGNLNFSFFTGWSPERDISYDMFLEPVISALTKFGVRAEKRGRNDLVVEGKKISGNAQCVHGGRILHHGTLLVNSDLSVMPEVLSVPGDKIVSKGIKSVRSRVANICEFTKGQIDIESLKQALEESFFGNGTAARLVLSDSQIAKIEELADNKYRTWDWNIGSVADYSYRNARRFPGGRIEVRLDVKNGVIARCRVFGDFLALIGVEELENAVADCHPVRYELENALRGFDLPRYYGFTLDQLLECF